jgi:nitroimidazol reductase NimA-like FMN-containing flavoprotein (pyridoxamine 5'-phosphate oxidase superfamily)
MMTEQVAAFLARPWVTVLAVAASGRGPLAVPVWYALNADGQPWFVTSKASPKARLIETAGRITLTMQREALPYAYVSLEGAATLATARFADLQEVARRYLGKTEGDAYAESMREAYETGASWRITLRPERVSTYGLEE